MAFTDGLKRNPAPQQPIAPAPQPSPSIDSLPANVKEQATEAMRPAAKLIDQATTPKEPSAPKPTPNAMARGRSLGMER